MRKSLYQETEAYSAYIFPSPPTDNPLLQDSVLSPSGLLFPAASISSPESALLKAASSTPWASSHSAVGLCNTLDLHSPPRLECWMLCPQMLMLWTP